MHSVLFVLQLTPWPRCIMIELFSGNAVFQGRTEVDQLELIFRICGSPDTAKWPEIKQFPWFGLLKVQKYPRILQSICIGQWNLSTQAVSLIDALLTLNPSKRPTAKKALGHAYFCSESPPPCLPHQYAPLFSAAVACHCCVGYPS